jgi:uncharacterized protein
MSPGQKRVVWRRITLEAKAWRFNKYAERAGRATGADHPEPALLDADASAAPSGSRAPGST